MRIVAYSVATVNIGVPQGELLTLTLITLCYRQI